MSRRTAAFRQSDLARALRAAKQAGVNIAVEIFENGRIRLVPYREPPPNAQAVNEWD